MTPHEEIAAVLSAIEAAWNAGDARAYARLFAPDAVYVTRVGAIWYGRPAIEEGHGRALAGPLAGTTISLRPTHISVPAASVVVAQVDIELSSDAALIKAVTTFVLGLDSGQWRIVAAHTSESASVH